MGAPGTTPGPWACQPVETCGPDYGVSIVGLRLNENGAPLETPTNGIVGAALPHPTEVDSGDYSRVIANANQMKASPDLYDALAASLRILRTFLGRGTAGGSCGLCGSTWHGDAETHTGECQIAVATAALAKARGEA